MKKINVLWLVEHIVREMDVACAVKSLVKARYGVDITIRNIYLHANDVMKEYFPSIVVFPFLYRRSDLAIEDYVETWPGATYSNLAWEQVHYQAHLKMKAPGDEFTKNRVIHHAWGDFYKTYLVESGVPSEHIFLNGHPAYQLYKEPYNKYFKSRNQLARENGINSAKKWVFIPENYKWAFFSDAKLQRSAERGGDLEEHIEMRTFCRESLGQVLRWCNAVAKKEQLEIIFRPRPATNSQQMESFFKEIVGTQSAHLHITKSETVRDWIMASDVVVSSYSTSLIEAAIAGKSIFMLEPIPIPASLYCDWYDFVSRLHTSTEFEEACLAPVDNNYLRLQMWAEDAMLSNGDPISGLADFIANLIKSSKSSVGDRRFFFAFSNIFSTKQLINTWGLRQGKRLVRHSGYAIHSVLSAIKIIILYLISLLTTIGKERKAVSLKSILIRVSDRLQNASHLFAQSFKHKNYYNPATHENDEFTEVEVLERVEKWDEILANN